MPKEPSQASGKSVFKHVLPYVVVISLLIAAASLAAMFTYDDILELYFEDTKNEINQDETVWSLVKNIIFLVIFTAGIIFGFKKYSKIISGMQKWSKPEIKLKSESKPEVNPIIIATSKQDPKKLIFIYIILIPSIHALIVMFSGNIIHLYKDSSEVVYMDLYNVIITPAIILWAISAKRYLWIWKKTLTSEWFKIFGYDKMILERTILKKVMLGTLTALIISLSLVILLGSTLQIRQNAQGMELWELFSLGIFFNLMIIIIFSFVKMQEQNAKKDFHLYMASGYCKKAIKSEDVQKSQHMRDALNSYNDFFKRNHNNNILDNIEKINVEILSKERYTKSTIDEISRALESGNSYLPLEMFATLMNKNKGDLLKNNNIIERLRYWSGIIGPVLAAIGTFLLERFLF